MIRTGLGYDIHRLERGSPGKRRRFLLAGVEIPFSKGETGHSDGDALAHAVCDAILGAAGLGDIGEMFPPSEPAWKDADSMALLRKAFARVKQAGWRLVNLDCVVICEKPKVLPYRDAIRNSLAEALEAGIDRIFVKGKTKEGLGPVGKGKAVEVLAQCLIENQG
ncbi:MAG: 2-C-methyl-D-erythritol 2,4-cyclodiphosphate synthase [Treponema sp.]|jgi:2-C-methyl-D-erythritol 2,4-cyclodiphosphate synthase|nr:2-C-methyl-D-erythritol 2,4-cyclodiphosphate synthase [Treponema sp.]